VAFIAARNPPSLVQIEPWGREWNDADTAEPAKLRCMELLALAMLECCSGV